MAHRYGLTGEKIPVAVTMRIAVDGFFCHL
jgi:hypothetical protein